MFRSGAVSNLSTSVLSVTIKHTIIVLTHNKYECKGTLPMNEEELDLAPSEYEPPDQDDWFEPSIFAKHKHPHDSMPIATDDGGTYSSRHESTPDHEKGAEEIVTMHEKMYRMATKNGGSWLGGSENCHGGSEQAWWTDGEQKFTPENDPYGGY